MALDDNMEAPPVHGRPKATQKPASQSVPLPESIPEQPSQEPPAPDVVDVAKLKQSLQSIIGKIKELHTLSMDMSFEKSRTELIVKNHQVNALAAATEATDAGGKKLNSNDTARKSHADSILAKSEAYQAMVARVEELKTLLWKNDIELEYTRNLLRGMEIISRYRQ